MGLGLGRQSFHHPLVKKYVCCGGQCVCIQCVYVCGKQEGRPEGLTSFQSSWDSDWGGNRFIIPSSEKKKKGEKGGEFLCLSVGSVCASE